MCGRCLAWGDDGRFPSPGDALPQADSRQELVVIPAMLYNSVIFIYYYYSLVEQDSGVEVRGGIWEQ